MKITRFQKIKQHRIFRDFAWPGTVMKQQTPGDAAA